ncbi:MAG TPA: DUF3147 family protein [Dokdonella sp.]|nr:DUF3147 family protein [Dokdonella sp.]
MWQYGIKIALTALVVVVVSEIAKRSSFWAAILASLPLTSLLAFAWLYLETGDSQRVAALSQGIFWLVIPSLPLFLVLPVLLRAGVNFWASLGVACVVTVGAYFVMLLVLGRFGVRL